MPMTPEQHAELNQWIGRNLFQKKVCTCYPNLWERRGTEGDSELYCTKCQVYLSDARLISFTTSPADAMAVLEECAEKIGPGDDIEIGKGFSLWRVSCWRGKAINVEAETLPLAICLFARQLFSEKEAAK